jgi:hypothetical protein
MSRAVLLTGTLVSAMAAVLVTLVLGALLLAGLPEETNASVRSYAWVLTLMAAVALVLVLPAGSLLLYTERTEPAPAVLQRSATVLPLVLSMIAFIMAAILLSIFQRDLQPSVVRARNLSIGALVLTFVAIAGLIGTIVVLGTPYTAPARNSPRRSAAKATAGPRPLTSRGPTYGYGMTTGSRGCACGI